MSELSNVPSSEPRLDQVFFYALAIESRPLEARLEYPTEESNPVAAGVVRFFQSLSSNLWGKTVQWGVLNGKSTAIVRTGAGQSKAQAAVRAFLEIAHPSVAWSVGFAGALNPDLKQGQIVSSLIPLNEPRSCLIDVEASATQPPHEAKSGCAYIYTADRIVAKASEKTRLYEETRAQAVDMETDAVARVCAEFQVPLKCVRVITDTAQETLPPDLERTLNQKSVMGQMGAVLRSLCKKPVRVLDLLSLKATALESAEKLADYLEKQ